MLFFCISILMYFLQNFSNKQFGRSSDKSSAAISLMQNGICTLSAALVLALFGKISVMPVEIMVVAFVFGTVYLLTVFLLLKAFMYGSMGGSTLLCNIGMFISAYYGVLKFGDEFSLTIAAGSVLMLAAIILSLPEGGNERKDNRKWFVFALASGIANGVVASIKREAVAMMPGNINNFLFWGFLFASATAFFVIIINDHRRAEVTSAAKNKKLILFGIFAGVGTAGGNLFQMLSLKTISSAIVYPFTAGILVIVLYLASLLLYRETKLRAKNLLAVLFCVTAIIVINIK